MLSEWCDRALKHGTLAALTGIRARVLTTQDVVAVVEHPDLVPYIVDCTTSTSPFQQLAALDAIAVLCAVDLANDGRVRRGP